MRGDRLVLMWRALLVAAVGCGSGSGVGDDNADSGQTPPPLTECSGAECPRCASGTQCAEGVDVVDGSCCAAGDNLLALGTGVASEAVEVESNGKYAVLCGGFGAQVSNVRDPAAPDFLMSAGKRCQRAAFGPTLAGDVQVLYLSHHGDSWVESPSLSTFYIAPEGSIRQIDIKEDASVLFEGLAFRDNYLFVAAHDGGLRVYLIDDAGIPVFQTAIGGFKNAWKIDLAGDFAYVADADAGLKVVAIADPLKPLIVQSLPTTGLARDVNVNPKGDRVYVALGGAGVDVFDATSPGRLEPLANIDTQGSAQSVDISDSLLAVANWGNVVIYDASTLNLLGTESLRQYPEFEQDTSVALRDDTVYVAEWDGLHILRYRQGFIAPDIWIEDELFQFEPTESGARAVVVRNRGPVELVVGSVTTTDEAFSLDKTNLRIPPGGADVFEVVYKPNAASASNVLSLRTNDPDDGQSLLEIPLLTTVNDKINVGDELGDEFAFLDPSGAGQLSSLRGKVIVLAYFALF